MAPEHPAAASAHRAPAQPIAARPALTLIGARTPANRQVGIDKCHRAGAVVSSTETVLFEMLEHAGSDQFKAISKLVR